MTAAGTVIPQELAESIPAIGLRWDADTLVVGLPSRFSDAEIDSALDTLVATTGVSVECQVIEEEEIRKTVALVYSALSPMNFAAPRSLDTRSEGPIITLVNNLIDSAVQSRASDIHIEPMESSLIVRVRIDGKLEVLTELDLNVGPSILSRLKVLAKLSIVERRRPQDGQFSVEVSGRQIDIRLSTVATLFGEKAALRLLDTRRNLGDLTTLGMSKEKREQFNSILGARHGLIIASGPTGSGKTTTLHSALKEINSVERNISTIEDPVEYIVDGVNHIPVNDAIGATFATQLRAIMRQDPDVVLVGEIRDVETARIAIQAALTGRLVLSTLHAPDALGVIYRLFQMEIEPYLVAAALMGVVSQRLVRKNCPYCLTESKPTTAEKILLSENLGNRKLQLQNGMGCTMCRNSGYLDRIGAFQLLEVSEEMRELISKRPNPGQLQAQAKKDGLRSLQEEALSLVASGDTSVSEVLELVAQNVE